MGNYFSGCSCCECRGKLCMFDHPGHSHIGPLVIWVQCSTCDHAYAPKTAVEAAREQCPMCFDRAVQSNHIAAFQMGFITEL